ncbi:coiled-coil domain-containing protein 105 [Spea bombifrons]|uniref:coiled-coil domain-containing protein 105 n=1 Tax=Spea bombifrons TaxID=233779 RepID=UPI0023490E6D|nr:coiled-coil domain-containing protein 105 [Spea bombifrons]
MAARPVGSASWRDASYQTIRLAQNLQLLPFNADAPSNTEKRLMSPQSVSKSLQKERAAPPPFHRDLISQKCDSLALSYMRQAQHSVFGLRKALLETNRHIQRLQRVRDAAEKAHGNVRRDIITNQETAQLRAARPKSERRPDDADALLQEEKRALQDQKKHLEHQLHEVSRQLKVLYDHRQKLSEFCKEKSSVLEVVGETSKPHSPGEETAWSGQRIWQDDADLRAAVQDAHLTCQRLRNAQSPRWQKSAGGPDLRASLTGALRRKAEESARIRDDVTLALGGVRNYMQRQQRLQDEMETSYQLQLGPVCSTDVTTRERLDRPLMKILQRHPVTQLPESTLISKGSASLQRSLERTRENTGVVQSARQRLKDDAGNKMWGERLDRAAVRLRERSAKNRRERLHL